jgi:hypothetical protein
LRLGGGAWAFDLHAGLVASVLSISGSGFAPNQRASRFSPAAAGGARILLSAGSVAPWFELSASQPFYTQQLVVVGADARKALKVTEVQLGLGVSFGRFR